MSIKRFGNMRIYSKIYNNRQTDNSKRSYIVRQEEKSRRSKEEGKNKSQLKDETENTFRYQFECSQ